MLGITADWWKRGASARRSGACQDWAFALVGWGRISMEVCRYCQEPLEADVALNGISLHYELRGEGPPLLLLHGGTGCHADWAYAGREFFEREYGLITPDARGHGSSTNDQPDHYPSSVRARHAGPARSFEDRALQRHRRQYGR